MWELPPRLFTNEERQCHRRLAITEVDERTMATECENFPQDVIDENAFSRGNEWSAGP
jgi:hypothetical protein